MAFFKEHHLPLDPELIKAGDYRRDKAKEVAEEFLRMKNPPTALFVSNEPMNNGVLLTLKENKVKIPEEMSIIGFDDPVWGPLTNPALTTITQPSYSMGTFACQALLKEMKGLGRSKTSPEDIRLGWAPLLRHEIGFLKIP